MEKLYFLNYINGLVVFVMLHFRRSVGAVHLVVRLAET